MPRAVPRIRIPGRPRRPGGWSGGQLAFLAVAAICTAWVALPILADGAIALAGARGLDGCRVLRVVDGDTVGLWCPGQGRATLRLTGFDAPEVTAPDCLSELLAGTAATWALRSLLLQGGVLRLRDGGRDRYGRRLAAASVDGRPVAARMIADGHARAYSGGPREGWCG